MVIAGVRRIVRRIVGVKIAHLSLMGITCSVWLDRVTIEIALVTFLEKNEEAL